MKPRRPFDWREGARNTRGELQNWITQYQGMQGGRLPVVVGLTDGRNRKFRNGETEWLYADHSYFDRGWIKHNFRLIRNGHHQTQVYPRPDDRLKRWNVQIEPWRKDGRSIVIIPPSPAYTPIFGLQSWLREVEQSLMKHTERPVHVKHGKGSLREYLAERDTFAVVCCISVAGMESALMGYPVFSTPRCCSWGVNAGPLEKIETPEYPERHAWACSLAYASWHADELKTIDFRDYMYAVKA